MNESCNNAGSHHVHRWCSQPQLPARLSPTRILANLSHLPSDQIAAIRQILRGEKLVPVEEALSIQRSTPHGGIAAVLDMLRKLEREDLLAERKCRERDLVVGMIVERMLHICSKLATTRAEELSVDSTSEMNSIRRWIGYCAAEED